MPIAEIRIAFTFCYILSFVRQQYQFQLYCSTARRGQFVTAMNFGL